MEDLYDPEEKILCPYNSSHHIRRCRMTVHLVKCKKNYGDQKMVPCDFNATHLIPEPELQYHHQICSDRKKIETQIVHSQIRSESKFPVPNIAVQTDENWDDFDCPTYDPTQYSQSNDILRHLDVESKAKRKNFRLVERQRLNELQSRQNGDNGAASLPDTQSVNLPPHRDVTSIKENTFNRSLLKDKMKMGADKVYLQY